MTGYIFIITRTGEEKTVKKQIRKLKVDGIKWLNVDHVAGSNPSNVIVRLRYDTPPQFGDVVVNHIHKLEGVLTTTTSVVYVSKKPAVR